MKKSFETVGETTLRNDVSLMTFEMLCRGIKNLDGNGCYKTKLGNLEYRWGHMFNDRNTIHIFLSVGNEYNIVAYAQVQTIFFLNTRMVKLATNGKCLLVDDLISTLLLDSMNNGSEMKRA